MAVNRSLASLRLSRPGKHHLADRTRCGGEAWLC